MPLIARPATRLLLLPVTLLLLLLLMEPVLANNVIKIGKGVVGDEQEKIRMLKIVAFYAGIFISISAVGIFAGRKKLDAGPAVAPVMLLIGLALISVKFF